MVTGLICCIVVLVPELGLWKYPKLTKTISLENFAASTILCAILTISICKYSTPRKPLDTEIAL